MPAIVSFVGWHNSGKTTLARKVVAELRKRGRRVAVVKSTKESDPVCDSPGTDSYLYRQTGAAVLLAGADSLVLQQSESKASLYDLAHRFFSDMELVVGEGFKGESGIPKIEVFRGTGPTLAGVVDNVVAVAGEGVSDGSLPHFSVDDYIKIANFIEYFHCECLG